MPVTASKISSTIPATFEALADVAVSSPAEIKNAVGHQLIGRLGSFVGI